MRTVIRDKKPSWRKVVNGVPQGSVLTPVMFTVYINDMTEGINSYVNLFADDGNNRNGGRSESFTSRFEPD